MELELIFRQQDVAKAEATFAQLKRFAERRNAFLGWLDFRQITPSQAFAIYERSDAINEAIVFAEFYLLHIADMDQLGRNLRSKIAA